MKKFLKRIPGIVAINRLIRHPEEEILRWKEYGKFKKQMGNDLKNGCSDNNKDILLVVSLMGSSVTGTKMEAFLTKAIHLKGLCPYILTSRGDWANRYYRLLGITNFIYLEEYIEVAKTMVIASEVEESLKTIHTFQNLMDHKYHGVAIGKYICSSLVRKTYTGSVDIKDPDTRRHIKEYLFNTMVTTIAAEKIFGLLKPEAAMFLERGYTPYGEFFDVAINYGLNTIQWCGSHRDDSFTLKRYNKNNMDRHPASLSEKTWEMLKRMPWRDDFDKYVRDELFQNYSSGKWFSEVGTQFNTKLMEPNEVRKMLDIDSSKKTAVLFSHLFWDATFFWGQDLFNDYREWFIETIKGASNNNKLNWIIKLHPANIVKLNRDGYDGELIEKITIKEHIGTLPEHIKILEPSTPINTYSIFNIMDYCITVRGTIGIEAAFFGIPVFTAGTGRYDNHGFTIDSHTREDYLEKIGRIQEYPPLTDEQRKFACRFACGTFIFRPFNMKSLNISYKNDKKATQQIQYRFESRQDLLNAEDVSSFGEWVVNSKDEDYLIPSMIHK